jgi:hypothetical protein
MIKDSVRRSICEREGILNSCGYDPHHCFFLSEYFSEDRNDEWNVEPVKRGVHECIHSGVDSKWKLLEIKLKEKALGRYAGKNKDELIKILKNKSIHYGVQR